MKRKRISEKPKKTILIVTASEAESLYFSQMRKDCRYTNMSIIWDNEALSVEDLIKRAAKERTRQKFDSVWALFSFDSLDVTDEQLKLAAQYAKKRKVQLAWVKPSFALWYYLHLQLPRKSVESNEALESALKGVFPNFNSSSEYLLTDGASLHLKLFPAKAQAVVNSGQYNTMALEESGGVMPINMTKLTNDISAICGVADMTHNQKLIGLKKN